MPRHICKPYLLVQSLQTDGHSGKPVYQIKNSAYRIETVGGIFHIISENTSSSCIDNGIHFGIGF